jgi:hypothetical protein
VSKRRAGGVTGIASSKRVLILTSESMRHRRHDWRREIDK